MLNNLNWYCYCYSLQKQKSSLQIFRNSSTIKTQNFHMALDFLSYLTLEEEESSAIILISIQGCRSFLVPTMCACVCVLCIFFYVCVCATCYHLQIFWPTFSLSMFFHNIRSIKFCQSSFKVILAPCIPSQALIVKRCWVSAINII